MQIRDLYREGSRILSEAGIESPNTDARVILEFLLNIGSGTLALFYEKRAAEGTIREYLSKKSERRKNRPLSYITGTMEFVGLGFQVREGVLVPRPETENLVSAVLENMPSNKARVADLCSGSGCIGITIAKMTGCAVDLYDISDIAVKISRTNAEKHGARDVSVIKRDILKEGLDGTYDVIVSNPPYIPIADMPGLMPDVRDYEPEIALTDGADGFTFYKRLARLARAHLSENGILAAEAGIGGHREVSRIFREALGREPKTICDYFGIERVVIC
jgi:release factor glutamine methyltransferase